MQLRWEIFRNSNTLLLYVNYCQQHKCVYSGKMPVVSYQRLSVCLNTHFKSTYHHNSAQTMLSRACHPTPSANRWAKPHARIYISFSKRDSQPKYRNMHLNRWMDSFQTPTNNTVDKCYMLTVVMLRHYNAHVNVFHVL